MNYVAPNVLQMPDEVYNEVAAKGIKQTKSEKLTDEILAETDILYVTRVQQVCVLYGKKGMNRRDSLLKKSTRSITVSTSLDLRLLPSASLLLYVCSEWRVSMK